MRACDSTAGYCWEGFFMFFPRIEKLCGCLNRVSNRIMSGAVTKRNAEK